VASVAGYTSTAGISVTRRLLVACSCRGVVLAAALLALLFLVPPVGLVHYIYFDRSGLPALEPFIRFEIPTIGEIYDAQGTVLVELAREYRRVVAQVVIDDRALDPRAIEMLAALLVRQNGDTQATAPSAGQRRASARSVVRTKRSG
jgi:hypothetical protein